MSKRKKKKRHEDHIDESWLLPYSDLLTLLVALFIVLFASSSIDMTKFQALSSAFQGEFSGGVGIFDYPSPVEPHGKGSPEPQEEEEEGEEDKNGKDENEEEKENQEKEPELTEEQLEEQKMLAEILSRIEQYIKENGLEGQFDTSLTIEGLSLTIRDNILFASGSANVRSEDRIIAKEIANLLEMDVPRSIIVSGHTDNVPISNSQFQSNWDLSVMRAVNFMKILLENGSFNPKLFSARGYGEFHPVATNDTAEGRSKNRRVEILILPRTNESLNE